MFTVMNNPTVWWPVVINVPIDGGETSNHEVSLQLEILEEDEYDELALKGEKAVLKRVIKAWKHIDDIDKKPLAYSGDNLDMLLKKSFVHRSFMVGYLNASIGAVVKN
ncbi:hypothetical protein [Colwellia psychrerythraea]|uniref:Uncharacterized protein n=1 Tax=Colwellia psychrerythraea TaxID=28229 RepID=A0A099K9Z9_COLPS|nr:hypothetical protein [Colwellia psychrerythraea]KGJ86448.1 hypothetical protein ND2E_1014 [Colwellia psychrerythraea]